jgi:hypothetical protein
VGGSWEGGTDASGNSISFCCLSEEGSEAMIELTIKDRSDVYTMLPCHHPSW